MNYIPASKAAHCCELMDAFLQDDHVPLCYSPVYREYGLILRGLQEAQMLSHCPWCGTQLPSNLYTVYRDTLKKQFRINIVMNPNDPRIPDEFRTDQWWKKRGL